MGPVFPRRGLVDQSHHRRVGRVASVEESSADEAHPQRAEVSRADAIDSDGSVTGKTVLSKLRAIFKIAGDRRASFYTDPRRLGPVLDWQPVRDRGRLYSRQRVEALLNLTVQLDPRYEFLAAGAAVARGTTILVVGHIDLNREQATRRKSGIGQSQADEALHDQSGADQQQHRQSHFSDHEQIAHSSDPAAW